MTRSSAILVCGFLACPAGAQTVSPLNSPAAVNPAILATKAEVAALQAQIPQPSNSIPVADMATSGQVGSSARYRRPDDQAPRISRTVSGTTGASGTAVVTWPSMGSVPKLTVTPYVTSADTQVPTCYPVAGTITTTGATIKCFRTQTLLGLGLLPFTVAPAGVQFDVLALPQS